MKRNTWTPSTHTRPAHQYGRKRPTTPAPRRINLATLPGRAGRFILDTIMAVANGLVEEFPRMWGWCCLAILACVVAAIIATGGTDGLEPGQAAATWPPAYATTCSTNPATPTPTATPTPEPSSTTVAVMAMALATIEKPTATPTPEPTPTPTPAPWTKEEKTLARLMWVESRGECEAGQIMVGMTVRNRARLQYMGETVQGIATSTAYALRKYPKAKATPDLLALARRILAGEFDDDYPSNLVFFRTADNPRRWYAEAYFFQRVGFHNFYTLGPAQYQEGGKH